MFSTLIELLPVIAGAAILPAVIILVIILLQGEGGLQRAIAFVLGASTMRIIQGLLFGALFGSRAQSGVESERAILDTIITILGVMLLITAYRYWSKEPDPDAPPPKWMASLTDMGAGKAYLFGIAATGIAPKQWIFSIAAVQTIVANNLGWTVGSVTFLFYIILASSLLIVPIIVYIASPQKAAVTLGNWNKWLEKNNRAIMIVVSLVFGAVFLWTGVTGLMG